MDDVLNKDKLIFLTTKHGTNVTNVGYIYIYFFQAGLTSPTAPRSWHFGLSCINWRTSWRTSNWRRVTEINGGSFCFPLEHLVTIRAWKRNWTRRSTVAMIQLFARVVPGFIFKMQGTLKPPLQPREFLTLWFDTISYSNDCWIVSTLTDSSFIRKMRKWERKKSTSSAYFTKN